MSEGALGHLHAGVRHWSKAHARVLVEGMMEIPKGIEEAGELTLLESVQWAETPGAKGLLSVWGF